MFSRRQFIATSTALGAAAVMDLPAFAYDKKFIGLQMTSVRNLMSVNPAATLAQVAKIGYNSIEAAATYSGSQLFYGSKPTEFASMLAQTGLSMFSSTYLLGRSLQNGKPTLGTILHGWEKAVEDAAAIGIKYMVCGYLDEYERGSIENYKRTCEELNKAGAISKKSGIQLCYHNMSYELQSQGGLLPYDTLLAYTDKNLVKMELDFYWLDQAGKDPLLYLKNHPGRFPLWHLNRINMPNSPAQKKVQGTIPSVGNLGLASPRLPTRFLPQPQKNKLDFDKIFAQAPIAGLKYFYVENWGSTEENLDRAAETFSLLKQFLPA